MQTHKKELVDAVKAQSARLALESDERVMVLYKQWSHECHCAGWITQSELGVKAFIEWATTAPCDIYD